MSFGTYIDNKYLKLTVNVYEPYDNSVFPVFTTKKIHEKSFVPENILMPTGYKRQYDVFMESAGKRIKKNL
jgi:hypothetical protein